MGIRTPVLTVKGWCPNLARRWGQKQKRNDIAANENPHKSLFLLSYYHITQTAFTRR